MTFPGTVKVRGDQHRLKFEAISLPRIALPHETPGAVVFEEVQGADHSPLFLIPRSSLAAQDGRVQLIYRRPRLLGSVTALKVFDFQPFGAVLPGGSRTVKFGHPLEPLKFAAGAARLDANNGAWATMGEVNAARVKLTLVPIDPWVWKQRPRPPSVVVAWKPVAKQEGPYWPRMIDRGVLVEGEPLVIRADWPTRRSAPP